MKSALEGMRDLSQIPRLSTGNGDLDALLGGIEPSSSYLLYGDREIVDKLAHRLLVMCVLPKQKGGFESQAIYFNNTNYYKGKTILNPSLLGEIAKHVGVDPKVVLANVSFSAAYNEERQKIVSEQLVALTREVSEIGLVVVHNLTQFLVTSSNTSSARESVKQVLKDLKSILSHTGATAIITGEAKGTRRGFTPRPVGGNFFRHFVNSMVHFSSGKEGRVSSVRATLVKHPCKRTPQSIRLYVERGGVDLMGRITPSFRQLYDELLSSLKTKFQSSLIDLDHREAFDLLLKEAWGSEQAAMGNSGVPVVLDSLNLMGNIHNRKIIQSLERRLDQRDDLVKKLEKRLERMESELEQGKSHMGV